MTTTEIKTSPMMAQWQACKEVAGDALLLFRMGDFYEAFHDDAATLAKELELTLTKRQEVPMSGVPYHASENYIDKLVSKGFRVAIAEQTEDPKQAKGLVKREVVRVVTPATVINSSLLSEKDNNFFAAIARVGSIYGLSILDLSTAEFYVMEFDSEGDLANEIHRLRPSEILVATSFKNKLQPLLDDLHLSFNFLLNTSDDWRFEHENAYRFLAAHFTVHNLDGLGLKGMLAAINAGGALLNYIRDLLSLSIDHVETVHTYTTSMFLSMDRNTQRHLELTDSAGGDATRRNTLLHILDKTLTPMGGRLLRHWVKQPLLDVSAIRQRQDAVEFFFERPKLADQLGSLLDSVRDMERLMMKIATGYATPRDLVSLKTSLEPLPHIKSMLSTQLPPLLASLSEKIIALPHIVDVIAAAIVDEPPLRLNEGRIFRDGYHVELDSLRQISLDSKSWLNQYQSRIREESGIKTLKVGYNRMFGYYIEVSRGQSDKMPGSYQRRQTLVNAERFISPELKDFESKVLTAEERTSGIETELFNALRNQIAQHNSQVLAIATAIASLDCLCALAQAARHRGYVRPVVDDSQIINISDGRHPVIEAGGIGEKFISNDTFIGDETNRLLLITGPNMAGKSTYIRQVALMVIMAQMGSFIPASRGHIGIVDKVFTRIGASDDLSRGQSTFMVEMTETANILNNCTERSLVILDEIGRGTSTYDGISIAWSVAEYLLTCEGCNAKTLFATHYWELTKLEEKIPGAVNYNVAVHENGEQIVFLRKIVKGGTDKSYGIQVGKLAGLPTVVIERSKEILLHLEENANQKSVFEPAKTKRSTPSRKKQVVPMQEQQLQLTFFEPT